MTTIRIFRSLIKRIPVLSTVARFIYKRFAQHHLVFENSQQYWENRYSKNGDSGDGSYGRLASFKAEVINSFVKEQNIQSIIEFGCGDGSQLSLMDYPSYTGVDVSITILEKCKQRFSKDISKQFILSKDYSPSLSHFDAALSLDVIYHLVEDGIFDEYMHNLFQAASKWVVIYSSNITKPSQLAHVKHREFTQWIEINAPKWSLYKKIDQKYPYKAGMEEQTSFADFYFFNKKSAE